MEKISTESMISSLFAIGFDRVDPLLFTYTMGQLFTDNFEMQLFYFEDREFSEQFKKYVDYENGIYKLKKGITLDTNISPLKESVFLLRNALRTNRQLVGYLSDLDFRKIIIKKIKELGECQIENFDNLFSNREKEIIYDMFEMGNNNGNGKYNKEDAFTVELERIQDEKIRESTQTILNMLPDYFYEIPASSTGKYHPGFSLGDGGLVRHVKAASRIAEEMFRDEVFGQYDSHTQDLIRMAILLHDGFKSGMTNTGHTCNEHPILMSNFIRDNKDKLSISEQDANFVAGLILSHMGPWNKDKAGNEIMPRPETKEELLVHLCDYMASRKIFDVTFKNNEIVEDANREKNPSLKKKPRQSSDGRKKDD